MSPKKSNTDALKPDEIFSGEVAITPHVPAFDGDTLDRIIQYATSQGKLSARTVHALDTIQSGVVPPHAIQTRPGAGGKMIPYVGHVWATKLMNSAFGFLWDYENIGWEVFDDGSVATRNKMSVNVPIGYKPDGTPIFYTRVVTEIGSFEAYPKTISTSKDPNVRGKMEAVISPVTGKAEFTMNTADRVASSVSRGLPKCMLRAFNLGTELFDSPEDKLTPEEVWRSLVNTAAKNGISKQDTAELLKSKGFTGDQLPERFHEAYTTICEEGKRRKLETPSF